MKSFNKCMLMASVAGLTLCLPMVANAQSATREQELEQRLQMLEAAVNDLKAELAKTKEEAAEAKIAAKYQLDRIAPPPQAVAAPAPQAPSGFKFSGFIKTVGSYSSYSAGEPSSSNIRDFYIGQSIPVGNGESYDAFTANAKQSRLTASYNTEVDGHKILAYVEGDFQASPGSGTQSATNAYSPGLRRAFVTFDNFTIGQDWSTFQNPAVLPESTDYAGTLDGSVFVRQALIRYTHKISPNATFMISLENPETLAGGVSSASVTANDDDRMPDVAARIAFNNSLGEFTLSGVARQLRIVNGTFDETATGAGVSFAGIIPFGENKNHRGTFMLTYGDGVGRYLAAAVTPDAVMTNDGLDTIKTLNALASLKFGITPKARVNLMAGYHKADLPDSVIVQSGYTKTLKSVAINYFYSPVPKVDFGIEYRHAEREMFGGLDGSLDRVEAAAKYSF